MAQAPRIERRDVSFRFDSREVPRDWYGGDPFVTTHLNALSLLFPEGESFFVTSVKMHRSRVANPELAEQVAGFIGQEAMHGRAHRDFNQMMIDHGYLAAPKVDAWLRGFLRQVKRIMPARSQLAVTCALEHFTAILAEALLRDPRMAEPMHPSMRSLWLWHALEESEHKAVAFDVYGASGGGYARRVAIMALTTVVFVAVAIWVQARLLHARGILHTPWRWLRGLGRLWLWPGHFTRLIPAYLHYYLPGFHPSQRDTDELLQSWREQLFGERGQLSGHIASPGPSA